MSCRCTISTAHWSPCACHASTQPTSRRALKEFLNQPNACSETALHWAAAASAFARARRRSVARPLSSRARVSLAGVTDPHAAPPPAVGRSPSSADAAKVVAWLVDNGANLAAADSAGRQPIEAAILCDNMATARALVSSLAQVATLWWHTSAISPFLVLQVLKGATVPSMPASAAADSPSGRKASVFGAKLQAIAAMAASNTMLRLRSTAAEALGQAGRSKQGADVPLSVCPIRPSSSSKWLSVQVGKVALVQQRCWWWWCCCLWSHNVGVARLATGDHS